MTLGDRRQSCRKDNQHIKDVSDTHRRGDGMGKVSEGTLPNLDYCSPCEVAQTRGTTRSSSFTLIAKLLHLTESCKSESISLLLSFHSLVNQRQSLLICCHLLFCGLRLLLHASCVMLPPVSQGHSFVTLYFSSSSFCQCPRLHLP